MGLLTPCSFPRGGFLYTMIVPRGGFFTLTSSRVPGCLFICLVLDEIDTCIRMILCAIGGVGGGLLERDVC